MPGGRIKWKEEKKVDRYRKGCVVEDTVGIVVGVVKIVVRVVG